MTDTDSELRTLVQLILASEGPDRVWEVDVRLHLIGLGGDLGLAMAWRPADGNWVRAARDNGALPYSTSIDSVKELIHEVLPGARSASGTRWDAKCFASVGGSKVSGRGDAMADAATEPLALCAAFLVVLMEDEI